MQTFLPYPNYRASAVCLDDKRLGKQRVECKQIINTLENGGGWHRHPAVLMWAGYVPALKQYANVMIREWEHRGFNNNMPLYTDMPRHYMQPHWLGNEILHATHKRNLIRKDPDHYGQLWPNLRPLQGYYWPVP